MQDTYNHERDGQPCVFVDEHGKSHNALVTRDWSIVSSGQPGAVNLVYVVDDASKTDSYGLQIDRRTSVPHQDSQSAPGMYWK